MAANKVSSAFVTLRDHKEVGEGVGVGVGVGVCLSCCPSVRIHPIHLIPNAAKPFLSVVLPVAACFFYF